MEIENIKFYSVKIIALIYFSFFFFISTIFVSYGINAILPSHRCKNNETKSAIRLVIEICINFIIMSLAFYVIKHFVMSIPFPLNKQFGFNASQLNDVQGGFPVLLLFFSLQTKLKDKINYLITELNIKKDEITKDKD